MKAIMLHVLKSLTQNNFDFRQIEMNLNKHKTKQRQTS